MLLNVMWDIFLLCYMFMLYVYYLFYNVTGLGWVLLGFVCSALFCYA